MDDLFRGKESPLEGSSPIERQYSLEEIRENRDRNSPFRRSPVVRRTSPIQQSPYEKSRTNNRSEREKERWNNKNSTTHNGNNFSPDSHNEDRISPLSQSRDRASPVSQSRDRTSPINQSRDRTSPISQSKDRTSPIISQSKDRNSPIISQSRDRTSPIISQTKDRTSPVNQSRDRTSPITQLRDKEPPTVDSRPTNNKESKSEFPDYLTEYTTIKNLEQRRRYKADFNADYAEYRKLHSEVEKVSRRFAQLEERLRQEKESTQAYKVSKFLSYLKTFNVDG